MFACLYLLIHLIHHLLCTCQLRPHLSEAPLFFFLPVSLSVKSLVMEAWALCCLTAAAVCLFSLSLPLFPLSSPLFKTRVLISKLSIMLAGPVGPLNCGIGTFSAAELEKATTCRLRHKRWAILLQAGGTGGSLSERRWTDDTPPPFECVFLLKCVPAKLLY